MGVLDVISSVTNDWKNGLKAIDVRFGMQDEKPVYFVRTYNADKKEFWQGSVDANRAPLRLGDQRAAFEGCWLWFTAPVY